MHIIARMNVGGPAVEITEVMRGLDPDRFSQRLVTGYCAEDEADFLETQAPDVQATRIDGLGRSIRPTDDALVLSRAISVIRASRPDIVHTHTAKAGVLGGSRQGLRHGNQDHSHPPRAPPPWLLRADQDQGPGACRAAFARITDRIITVGDRVRDDLLAAGIGRPEQLP